MNYQGGPLLEEVIISPPRPVVEGTFPLLNMVEL